MPTPNLRSAVLKIWQDIAVRNKSQDPNEVNWQLDKAWRDLNAAMLLPDATPEDVVPFLNLDTVFFDMRNLELELRAIVMREQGIAWKTAPMTVEFAFAKSASDPAVRIERITFTKEPT